MHETFTASHESIRSMRTLRNGESAYFNTEKLKENEASVIGSVYLGDPRNEVERREMTEDHRRLDVIDLRNAPIVEDGKVYAGQIFDPTVNYIITQGEPDWVQGKGFKGLRSGESLTVGRRSKVSSERFDLADTRISGTHMTLYETKGGLIIEDNKSTNGTSFVKYEKSAQQVSSSDYDDTVPRVTHEVTVRTESELARVIDEKEVANWRLYLNETKNRQFGTVQDLIERPHFSPVTGVEIENKTFLFSKIMQSSSGRKYSVGYVSAGEEPGKLMPRLFYLSVSDGGWRSTPGIERDGTLSKGIHELQVNHGDEYGHYVQLTKPNADIISVLERQDRLQSRDQDSGASNAYNHISYAELHEIYAVNRLKSEGHTNFSKEVSVVEVRGRYMDAYLSGVGFADSSLPREKLAAMQLPQGFEPDFTQEPSTFYRTKHTLAGSTSIEVYPAQLNGRAVEWHVAHDDEKNRVWIDRIAYADNKVTTYGTQQEVILAGALSAKPFDYTSQLDNMYEGHDWSRHDDRYADMSQTLNRIPAIQHYRLSRGIYKK